MPLAINDSVQFFPFDPIRKEIHLKNAPLEGTVVEDLRRHYRVRLPYNAFCLVLKTNPTLTAAPTSS